MKKKVEDYYVENFEGHIDHLVAEDLQTLMAERYEAIIDIVDKRIKTHAVLLEVKPDSKECELRTYSALTLFDIRKCATRTISLTNQSVRILLFDVIITHAHIVDSIRTDFYIKIGKVKIETMSK